MTIPMTGFCFFVCLLLYIHSVFEYVDLIGSIHLFPSHTFLIALGPTQPLAR
jgi:hypothetical protein